MDRTTASHTQQLSLSYGDTTMKVRFSLLPWSLCLAGFLFLGLGLKPSSCHAQSAYMEQAKQLYQAKQWDQALYSLQKALRSLRGKPTVQKVPVYVYIGLSLYRRGDKGLAWKALEQAFVIKRNAVFPKGESKDVEAFFRRVQQRVLKRLGPVKGQEVQGGGNKTQPPDTPGGGGGTGVTGSPWPWVALSISAAALTGGVLLVANASANNSDLETWLEAGVAQGGVRAVLENSATPMRSSVSLQNIIGGVALGVAGIGIAGAIVLFVMQKPKGAKKSASLPPQHAKPIIHSRTTFLQVQ